MDILQNYNLEVIIGIVIGIMGTFIAVGSLIYANLSGKTKEEKNKAANEEYTKALEGRMALLEKRIKDTEDLLNYKEKLFQEEKLDREKEIARYLITIDAINKRLDIASEILIDQKQEIHTLMHRIMSLEKDNANTGTTK